jgi:hypothetical protein
MPGERLTLDPNTEAVTNAPLDLSGDEANGIALLAHDYPIGEDVAQYAESPDTEGALRASARPPNRRIPIRLRVAEPADGELTNLCVNPSFEKDLNGWTLSEGGTIVSGDPAFYRSSKWRAAGDYSVRVIGAVMGADGQCWVETPSGLNGIPVEANESYALAAEFNVLSILGGAVVSVQINWWDAAGALVIATVGNNLTAAGEGRSAILVSAPARRPSRRSCYARTAMGTRAQALTSMPML